MALGRRAVTGTCRPVRTRGITPLGCGGGRCRRRLASNSDIPYPWDGQCRALPAVAGGAQGLAVYHVGQTTETPRLAVVCVEVVFERPIAARADALGGDQQRGTFAAGEAPRLVGCSHSTIA